MEVLEVFWCLLVDKWRLYWLSLLHVKLHFSQKKRLELFGTFLVVIVTSMEVFCISVTGSIHWLLLFVLHISSYILQNLSLELFGTFLEVIVSIIYTYIKKFLNPFAKVLKKFSKVLKNLKNGMRALWSKSLFHFFFRVSLRISRNGQEINVQNWI